MADDAAEGQTAPVELSVVIPARNEARYIEACLRSVFAQDVPDLEVIVVDNGSTDETATLATRLGARVVPEPVAGLPRAREAGWRASRGAIIAYLDADTTIPPGFLAAYLHALQAHPEAVAVSSTFRFADGNWAINSLRFFNAMLSVTLIRLHLAQFIFGANFAVRRTALDKIGGFNTSICFYGEDTDLSQRLSRQGNILYLPHVHSLTSARRYHQLGTLRTFALYLVNYFAVVLFHRPWNQLRRRRPALRFNPR